MRKYVNKYNISISLLLPLASIFVVPFTHREGITYGLGIPFNFLYYMDPSGPPERILDIFSIPIKLLFRIDIYLASALVFLGILILASFLIHKLRGRKSIKTTA